MKMHELKIELLKDYWSISGALKQIKPLLSLHLQFMCGKAFVVNIKISLKKVENCACYVEVLSIYTLHVRT